MFYSVHKHVIIDNKLISAASPAWSLVKLFCVLILVKMCILFIGKFFIYYNFCNRIIRTSTYINFITVKVI